MSEPTTETAGTSATTSPEPSLDTTKQATVKKAVKSAKSTKPAKVINPSKKSAPTKTGVKAAPKGKATVKKAVKAGKGKVEKQERQRHPFNKKYPHVDFNPYRQATNYALAFNILANTGKLKPVSRKDLLAAFVKCGRDAKLAAYDLAVVLSPNKNGEGHRSSRKEKYYVERFENGFVRLHMA